MLNRLDEAVTGEEVMPGNRYAYDYIIGNGTVVDGSGSPASCVDVAIENGIIAAVGDLKKQTARNYVDATGLVVSPGFIDIHTHSDLSLIVDGRAVSMITQGVTTNTTGNCGLSPAPVSGETRHLIRTMMTVLHEETPWVWGSFGEYVKHLRKYSLSINVAPLVGHGPLRLIAMGSDFARPAGPSEIKSMCRSLQIAMDQGAFGLSTGLVYPPGLYSTTAELASLADVVAQHNGLYASHIRGEASTVLAAVQEVVDIAEQSNVKAEVSHHKAAGKENWGKVKQTYQLIRSANLSQLLPPWVHAGGTGNMLARLKDNNLLSRIAGEIVNGTGGWPNHFTPDWNDIVISCVNTGVNSWMQGKSVAQIAGIRETAPEKLVIDLILAENDLVEMVNFVISPEDMSFLIRQPEAIIASDGKALCPDGPLGRGKPHPRSYGTFARILRQAIDNYIPLTLEAAIHKITGKPAAKLGLRNRGLIRPGLAADITVFDPARVKDRATFENPHQPATGIHHVFVNGEPVIWHQEQTRHRPGRVLLH